MVSGVKLLWLDISAYTQESDEETCLVNTL
jgi:hypothetical protein